MKKFFMILVLITIFLVGCSEQPYGLYNGEKFYFYDADTIEKVGLEKSEEIAAQDSGFAIENIENISIEDFEKKSIDEWNKRFGEYYNAGSPTCNLETKRGNNYIETLFSFEMKNGVLYGYGNCICVDGNSKMIYAFDTGIYDSTVHEIPSFSKDKMISALEKYCGDELKMWEGNELDKMCYPLSVVKLKNGQIAVCCAAYLDERKIDYRRIYVMFEELIEAENSNSDSDNAYGNAD